MEYTNVGSKTQFVVQRDDDVPLRFCGAIIGCASEETDEPYVRHQVTVFNAESGGYVVAQYRADGAAWRRKQSAAWFLSAPAMIQGLRDPRTGKLSVAGVGALRQAADSDPQIAEAFVVDLA